MYSMAGLAEYAVVPATDVFPLPDGAAARGVGGARLRDLHRLRRGAARRRPARRRARRRRGRRRRRASTSSRSPRRSARRRSSRSTSATTSWRPRGGSAPPTSSTRRRRTPWRRVRELTDGAASTSRSRCSAGRRRSCRRSRCIRDGGRMVAVGIAPGKTTAPIEITRLVRRELRIIGSYGARTRTDMPEIIRLAAQGIFQPGDDGDAAVPAGRGRRRVSGAGARRDRRAARSSCREGIRVAEARAQSRRSRKLRVRPISELCARARELEFEEQP